MSPNTKNTKLIDRGIMPVVILTIVALVSVLLLALTASLTKDARDRQEELMKSENQRLLFPAADAFEPVELTDIEGDLPDVKKVDLAKKGGETIGYVLEVSKGAYGGQLPVLTGVNNDGQVVGVQILDNSETAGIGKKVEDPDYRDQFIGISSSDSVDVDTIAGATVSSASVNSSVRDALVAYGVLSGTGELPVKVDSKELIFADGVFEDMDKGEFDDNITAAWTVKDEAGTEIGTLFESTVQGYGGEVPFLTGFDPNGEIVGVALGDNNETEGFGKKWEDPENLEQFAGQKANEALEIDMIAEVTVTSYAMQSGIENAKAAYLALSGEAPPVDEPGDDIKLELFPGATFTALDVSQFSDDGITEAHKSDDGYVVGVEAKGFGGPMHILVGYDLEGVIKGVLLESHGETPGYGKAAEEAEYRDQYIGQKASDEIEVDQIAGSTTTSNAFVAGVQKTTEVYKVIDTLSELEEAPPVDEPEDDIKHELFPGATFTALDVSQFSDDGITEAHKSDDGYVIGAEAQGFGGAMKILVGYDLDGVIKGVLLESHGETPGFGKQAEEAEYRDQYIGQKAADEIEVDQIAGSTVTSKAFVEAVQQTAEVFKIIDTLPELTDEPVDPPAEDDIKHELFPGATFTALDVTDVDAKGITEAYKTDDGYVVGAEAQGFGGAMKILVGYDLDGVVKGVLLESHGETPGFGKQAEEAEYRDQYIGQNAADEIEVDQIAGSTVTSKAFVEAVQQTAEVFKIIDTLPELTDEPVEPPAEDDPKLELFPDATFEEVEATPYEEEGVTAIYQTEEGYVIEAVTKGYGGDLNFSVGYKMDGEITGLLVGENNETPGFGKQAEEAEYRDQYKGLNANEEIEVDAISGSTVTSNAIAEGVQKTVDVFKQLSGETPEEPPVEDDPKLELFPDATFEEVDASEFEEEGVTAIYQTDEGYVIEAVTKGYGGDLNFSLGYKMDGEITGLLVGENNETPGFGKQAEEAEYRDQYKGLNANEEIEVDAISGSTVTSNAIAEGVQKTVDVFKQVSGETPEEPPAEDDPKLELFPGATFTALDVTDVDAKGITDAYKTDDGYVIGAEAQGFGGAMKILVGYDLDGVIKGVLLESHGETPGFGKQAEEAEYRDQYIGQNAADEIEVDQIAGSTVTSKAFVEAVQQTAEVYKIIDTLPELAEEPVDPPAEDDIKHELFPGATFTALDVTDVDAKGITEAYKTDDGYVVGAEAQGFGGAMKILVGYDLDGVIKGVLLESHGETPGFGKQAEEAEYRDQYIGQNAADEIEVDQIAGSTVTSKAFVGAVQQTAEVFKIIDTLPELADEPVDPPAEDDPKLELFPDATFEEVDAAPYEEEGVTAIYQTEEGYVIEAVTKGYGGDLNFSIGYKMDGEITGLLVGENNETPGFGKQAEEAEYRDQYKGLNANETVEVDAISGSTVTSKAIAEGVQKTVDVFKQLSGETPEEPPVEEPVDKRPLMAQAVKYGVWFIEQDVDSDLAEKGIRAIFNAYNGAGAPVGSLYEIELSELPDVELESPVVLLVGLDTEGLVQNVVVKDASDDAKEALTDDYFAPLIDQTFDDVLTGFDAQRADVDVPEIEDLRPLFARALPYAAIFSEREVGDDLAEQGIQKLIDAKNATGSPLGTLVEVAVDGFAATHDGEPIVLLVALDIEGTVQNVLVVSHEETERYGGRALDEDHLAEYVGLELSEDNDIDAIGGVTVTSRALNKAVDLARDTMRDTD